ncbi:unnamed protein product [Prunus armeniaca]|uniref:Uncharacterized protein n=1 Tax=Prunus armeniaca TaxID=36596 RepID=A0A6J5U6D7_PRUAR|nr:unnamed protein product [Prunus armeniaca]
MAEDEMLFEKKKTKEKKLCTRATVGVCLMDIRGSNQRLKTAKQRDREITILLELNSLKHGPTFKCHDRIEWIMDGT